MSELTGMDRKIIPKRWTRKRIAQLSAGLAAVILIIYGFVWLGGGSTLRIDQSRVTVSTVSEGEFQEFIPVSCTVTPLKTFYLDAANRGRVAEIYLEEGADVEVGDSILRLDNTDLRMDIMYREAQLYEQINNLRNTRLDMERHSLDLQAELLEIDRQIRESERVFDQQSKLNAEGLTSRYDFDRSKEDRDYWANKRTLTVKSQVQDSILRSVQIQQLEASVERMEANLDFVRSELSDLVVRAPIPGQLTSLNANVGVSINQGERLGQIDRLDGFKLQTLIDEYYVSRIYPGLLGVATVENATCSLKVSKVYPQITDGKFRVDLDFQGRLPADLRRGQTLLARIMLGDLSLATLLPRGGFYNATGGRWVYLVDNDNNEAYRHDIELGRQNSEVYEVLRGLKPGDRVITSSYDALEDYSRIILK
ncbi:MAG TPA: efflux RND transporter periplasmic adaptor subunit [candidate division Zixibacteria bacterium]|nr:efflux RND transporter periplasmic adaptor subunit [candidate division Zixibacteria bacterium]